VFNLVLNACEGDGHRGASLVAIRIGRTGERLLVIQVDDDGPGFPAAALDCDFGESVSSKTNGWGLGLGLVAGLVRASGGTVRHENHATGGASVVVELAAEVT
jgi:C4-dicarboxylate-specific signal transduction histidine kinase